MGSVIIYSTTIIVVLMILSRSAINNRKIKTTAKRLVREINSTYKKLLLNHKGLFSIAQIFMVVWASIFSFISIFTYITVYLDTHFNSNLDFVFKVVAIVVSSIVVFYSVGYVLFISSKIHKFLYKVEDVRLKVDFISSYFITSTFLAVLLLFPEDFNNSVFVGLVMIVICYFLNLKVLLTLMIKPTNVKSYTEEEASFARVIGASILILIMLVLNLYLAVCFVDGLGEGAYLNANNSFDLFYYTIITFTTIGYGDIIPTTIYAKVLAIVISITSVICLTVFLSSVLSYRDSFEN